MWIIYNNQNHPVLQMVGNIELVFNGSEAAARDCMKENQNILEGDVDINNQYIVITEEEDGFSYSIADKTTMDPTLSADTVVADGVSEVVLSNLPIPFTVLVNGKDVEVDDGSLEFSAETPGRYNFLLQSAAYFTESFTVYAT